MKTGKKLHVIMALCIWVAMTGLSYAQGNLRTVTGRVTDEKDQPVSSASILLKGTGTATQTNDQGVYTIRIPGTTGRAVLVFSHVGFANREIQVGGQTTINITLSADLKDLNEVVVTGYSKQKREAITGSIAQISNDKLNDATSPNVSSLLQGKVPGVSVVNTSGRPDAAPTVRIRGRVTLNSTLDPLYVVDGVIQHTVPILNPDDIETLSVLKDASASSLYGSRGANGVIVITTKSAKPNSSQLNASIKAGISKYNMGKFKLMNATDLVNYYKGFANPTAIPSWFKPDLAKVNTDWVATGSQTAPSQEYDISYLGGSEKTKIYTDGNYYSEKGTVKGYDYSRYSARLNIEQKIFKNLTFSPKLSGTYTSTLNKEASVYDMYRDMPWDAPYYPDGSIVNPQVNGTTWYGRDLSNYLYNLQWNYGRNRVANLLLNGDVLYQITKELAFKSTNNVTYYHADANSYIDPNATNGIAIQGSLTNSSARRITKFTNQMLTFNKEIGDHSISALIAYEYSDYKYNDMSATGNGIVPGISVLTATSTPASISGTTNDYAFQSFLFNSTYGYQEKYFAQFSVRRDGASRFGADNKYGNFFSVGAAWNVHKEKFFKLSHVDYLRVKAAYGGVGNTPSALYPQYALYSLSAQYNGSPTAFPSQLGNASLTWEQTYDGNVGLEIGLFKRLNLMVEAYQKRTSNLLSSVPLAAVSGFNSYYDNIGSVRNRGVEVTLGGSVIRSKEGFNWELELNIGANSNRITKLYSDKDQVTGNYIYREGYDISTYYMKKWAGVNATNGNPQWFVVDPATGQNSLTSNYSAATLQMVGKGTPKYFGGINSVMRYKGFSLRATFSFSKGGLIYNSDRETFDSDGAYPTYNQMELKKGWTRWTRAGDIATHPLAYYGGNNNSNKTSSRYLEDGSFFRMRNATLSYHVPTGLSNKFKIRNCSIYATADNLFTATPFSGLDPETGSYALPRKFLFGINISL